MAASRSFITGSPLGADFSISRGTGSRWLLSRLGIGWRDAVQIATPETVVRWHRQGPAWRSHRTLDVSVAPAFRCDLVHTARAPADHSNRQRWPSSILRFGHGNRV
jgi:hypothetical protein